VSKGVLAKQEDLMDVFNTHDEEKICIVILNEGDYQVSDKERDLEIDSLFKDVASVLAEKCVNPDTSRPYTISMLERALRDIHFSVDLKRNAKQQALEVPPPHPLRIIHAFQMPGQLV
jgi:ribosome maturation protein SDO1